MRSIVMGAVFFGLMALGCGQGSDGGVSAGPVPLTAEADRCLDLVERGDFEAAVPACGEALRDSPQSQEVSDALEQARVAVETRAAEARAAAEGQ